jgi:hypothetical protein
MEVEVSKPSSISSLRDVNGEELTVPNKISFSIKKFINKVGKVFIKLLAPRQEIVGNTVLESEPYR